MKRLSLIILFFLLAALLFFLFFKKGFDQRKVTLKIDIPEETVSGEEIKYKVRIDNKNKTKLLNGKLTIFYPSGSIFFDDQDKPRSLLVQTINLGELDAKKSKEIELKAVITGEKGEIKKLKALLNFNSQDSEIVFEKSITASILISKLIIPSSFVGPPNAISNQNIQLIFDFRNETENDIENLKVKFLYPDRFDFQKSTPPLEKDNSLLVPLLKIGEGKRIVIEGRISGLEGETKRFSATLQKKIGDEFFDFQKTETRVVISSSPLILDLVINDKKNYIAKPGENLEYTIRFSNNSNYNFSALELKAKLEGEVFDFKSLKTNGFFDQNTNSILWNAAVEPLFSNLGPNQKGEIKFAISLKKEFPKFFGAKDFFLEVSANIETNSVPPEFHLEKISASDELITKVSSAVNFIAQAFYNDKQIPNFGPVPPEVGKKTTYTIHWQIINQGNDLVNVSVSSFLLPGVSWENKFKLNPSQSELNYNPLTGQVSWLIPVLPSFSNQQKFEAVFQVGIVPGPQESFQTVGILKESKFEAIDNFTKEKINLVQPEINSGNIIDAPGVVR